METWLGAPYISWTQSSERKDHQTPMFYVIMGIMATAVALLMYNHDAGEIFGYPIEMVASVTLMGSLLLFLLNGRLRVGSLLTSLKQAGIWLLVGFVLVLGYSFRDDARMILSRVTGELIPSAGVVAGDGSVSFSRSENGHFRVQADINGVSIPMIVDTGASAVVLTYEDAQRVGLNVDALSFSAPVSTANGRALTARVWLSGIAVGGIEEDRIPAMVATEGALDESLLGMSYLDRLGSWTVRGDRMTMQP